MGYYTNLSMLLECYLKILTAKTEKVVPNIRRRTQNTKRRIKMGDEIRISAEAMQRRASQYRNEADTVNGVIGTMNRLLSELQEEWKGQAAEAYAGRYSELKPSFMKMEELIREIADALEETSHTLAQTDSHIASRFSGN